MPYSIDLAQISLDDFQALLTSVDLLPGRRLLLNDLAAFIARVQQNGIRHLAALQKALKDKKHYPELAAAWGVGVDYLTVLNREINSYVSKPLPLADLEVFDAVELEALAREGLKTSKDLYERCAARSARQALAERITLPAEKLAAALEMADLLRINGVGPVFAGRLRTLGICSTTDYRQTASQEILARYQAAFDQSHLGIKDIEYCKRFAEKLSSEIDW
jgi:hypothetical protein